MFTLLCCLHFRVLCFCVVYTFVDVVVYTLFIFLFLHFQNCSFGYFVGGWGKPPVDEVGRPLYGDVFGLEQQEAGQGVQEEEEIDKTLWGELESEEEEEEEEEEVGVVSVVT